MDKGGSLLSTPLAILLGSFVISVSILISGGVIKLGKSTTTTPTQQAVAPTPSQQPTVSLAHVKNAFDKAQIKFGDSNTKLVAIEVADPSCPFCHIAAGKNPSLNKQVGDRFTLASDGGSYVAPVPELEKLAKDGKASFAYIYFPGHGNGEMGAKALYCANDKGKFWEVHNSLMTADGYDLLNNKIKNDKSKSGDLADFLKGVFDPTTMKSCLDSGKYDDRLKQDVQLATGLGIQGTPGFYLNATSYPGAYSYSDMEATVKSALGS